MIGARGGDARGAIARSGGAHGADARGAHTDKRGAHREDERGAHREDEMGAHSEDARAECGAQNADANEGGGAGMFCAFNLLTIF